MREGTSIQLGEQQSPTLTKGHHVGREGLTECLSYSFTILAIRREASRGDYLINRQSGGFLAGVVLQQAAMLAVLGFLPGVAISAVLYWLTRAMAHVPIEMTAGRVFFVLGLSVLMCTISGLGALRKVRSADPADLF